LERNTETVSLNGWEEEKLERSNEKKAGKR
jgi:hypothetical protein